MTMKGLFLDRDGVINYDNNYVHKIEDFIFKDSIFELCRLALHKNYLIFVITNQAGIGRGIYNEGIFNDLTRWMLELFEEQGIKITKVYYCPYHPIHGIGKYRKDSYDRKPKPGMIIKASKEFGINLNNSILIGDQKSDIKAGVTAGIKKNILLSENKIILSNDHISVKNLKEAMDHL